MSKNIEVGPATNGVTMTIQEGHDVSARVYIPYDQIDDLVESLQAQKRPGQRLDRGAGMKRHDLDELSEQLRLDEIDGLSEVFDLDEPPVPRIHRDGPRTTSGFEEE